MSKEAQKAITPVQWMRTAQPPCLQSFPEWPVQNPTVKYNSNSIRIHLPVKMVDDVLVGYEHPLGRCAVGIRTPNSLKSPGLKSDNKPSIEFGLTQRLESFASPSDSFFVGADLSLHKKEFSTNKTGLSKTMNSSVLIRMSKDRAKHPIGRRVCLGEVDISSKGNRFLIQRPSTSSASSRGGGPAAGLHGHPVCNFNDYAWSTTSACSNLMYSGVKKKIGK